MRARNRSCRGMPLSPTSVVLPCRRVFCSWSALAILILGTVASAEEVTVQNDSLMPGDQGAVQAGFVAGETAAVWLTSPCNGDVVAVQMFWRSTTGGAPQSMEDSIAVANAGTFPTPGAVKQNGVPPYQDVILEGPVMTDGVFNEFRYLDEQQTVPIQVPVAEGETFVVTFKLANDPPGTGPSLVTDTDGCQYGKNAVDEQTLGWTDLCLFGVSGDLVIRAVIDCPAPLGSCCYADGICVDDVEQADCEANYGAVWYEWEDCSTIICNPRGACCRAGGCLDLVEQTICEGPLEGVYAGHGTACANQVCVPGACCSSIGECTEVFEVQCDGTFEGPGTSCDPNPCVQPEGACCFDTFCLDAQLESACTGAAGEWAGPFTTCPPNHAYLCPICDDGDADRDGDVDLEDFAQFQICFNGPGGEDCKCLDMDNDIDVDLADYESFQSLLEIGGPS